MESADVCLVLVFNHRYEPNLDALDRIYGDRFSHRIHLMPFYGGDRPDVAKVYEASHHFQGFFAQAHSRLRRTRFKHYVFCADDLILHPSLNERNIVEALGLSAHGAYIKSFSGLDEDAPAWPYLPAFRWEYAMPALVNLADKQGVDPKELPSFAEAVERFRFHGVGPGRIHWAQLRQRWQVRSYFLFLFYLYKRRQLRKRQKAANTPQDRLTDFPYPLAKGYADFFIVPGVALDRFCHLSGVLAAMDVFVEIAIPTALLLCCDEIVQEKQTRWRGVAYWSLYDARVFAEKHNYEYATLVEQFEDDLLYVHPIKLSQWRV
jgi:hypothetical protein